MRGTPAIVRAWRAGTGAQGLARPPLALASLALSAALAIASPALGAARLEYRGMALTARQAESLAQPALRAPGDSASLARALGAVVERLQELGHLDARANGRWDGRERLAIEVVEGARYELGSIVITAGPSADSARFARALPLAPGDPAAPRAVAAAIERALTDVVDHGFPYAELGVSGWDADSGRVTLLLSGTLGPAVTVTRARVEGLKVTRPSLAEKAVGRLAGLPYDRAAAEAGRDRLVQLGLFRSVSFEGLEGEGDWSKGQLVFKVEEPRYNLFEGAFGVQGDAGTVGLGRLDLGNLLGTGRAMSLTWQGLGNGNTDFGARFIEPLVLGAPLRLELALAQQVRDTLYARTRWGGRLQFLRSGADRLEAGYEQERVVQSTGPVEEASLQNTLFAVERSTLAPAEAPRRGSRLALRAAQIFRRERLRPLGTRSSTASAFEGRGEWTRGSWGASAFALEAAAAGRFGSQRFLPVYERYAVGGAATLRGHDEEAFRVDRFALTRLEWRWFMGRAQRAFLFWDHAWMATRVPAANASDRLDTTRKDGLGFGLRLESAGGVVGIDYGLEPGRPPLDGKIHLRLVSAF